MGDEFREVQLQDNVEEGRGEDESEANTAAVRLAV